MSTQGDSLIRKTQKGLSILAFETTKQSRILKKRMRSAALQKEIKADLRDLGNLVYNAVINHQPGILEEEEVGILVGNIRANKEEVEHLRDAIARLSRAHKHFPGGEPDFEGPAAAFDEEPGLVVEPAPPVEEASPDLGVSTEREMKEAVLDATPVKGKAKIKATEAAKKPPAKKAKQEEEAPSVPPAPGTDPGHPETGEEKEAE